MEFETNLMQEALEQGITRYTVGAITSKGLQVLLLKRLETDFMGGIYELPGGRVQEGESLEAALHREAEEETGLRIAGLHGYVGHFDYQSESGEPTRQFNFAVSVIDLLKIQLREHDTYVWVDRAQLEKYPVTEELKTVLHLYWSGVGGKDLLQDEGKAR